MVQECCPREGRPQEREGLQGGHRAGLLEGSPLPQATAPRQGQPDRLVPHGLAGSRTGVREGRVQRHSACSYTHRLELPGLPQRRTEGACGPQASHRSCQPTLSQKPSEPCTLPCGVHPHGLGSYAESRRHRTEPLAGDQVHLWPPEGMAGSPGVAWTGGWGPDLALSSTQHPRLHRQERAHTHPGL